MAGSTDTAVSYCTYHSYLQRTALQLFFFLHTGHNFNRVWVITGGCLLWGVMTGGFSLCTVLWQVQLLSIALRHKVDTVLAV